MKNKLLTLAGALALLAVLGHFYAKPLLAQVRAALVQSVDEPGRHPFALSASGGESSWTVPAGKRYVIEEFGGDCTLDPASPLTSVELIARNPMITGQAFAQPFFESVNGTFSEWLASGTTRLYVDPGATISIFAVSPAVVPSCFFTVSGYVINLP